MKRYSPALLALVLGAVTPCANGHPGHEGTDSLVFSIFAAAAQSTGAAGKNEVTITVEGNTRIIRSNGLPDHQPGQFPNRGNPHMISAQRYEFRMTTKPQDAPQPVFTGGAWFGVAVNGVPFEPGTAEFWQGDRRWNYEALGGSINLGIDRSNAHVQPSGAYHYHALPEGLITNLGGDGKVMRLVGWAADGYPIYSGYGPTEAKNAASPLKRLKSSWQLKKGARDGGPGGKVDGTFTADFEYVVGSGDLDECNGRFEVTPEFPQGTYAYHITGEFPWIGRNWKGTPDASFSKRMGPGPGGPGGPGGRRGKGPGFGPPPPFGPPPGGPR
jgi:hypothetical protein